MKYTIRELDQKTMSVKEFLEHEKEIPYYKLIAGHHYITLSELREKYYYNDIYFYNIPEDFGSYDDGVSDSFDRLFAEVKL